MVPLFDNSIGDTSAGPAYPSSPLASSVSGSSAHEGLFEPTAKIAPDGKLGYPSRSSIVVEISNLNKVKECYTEDLLQDPKHKVHKPVKETLRLEIEKHQAGFPDVENISESGSVAYESHGPGECVTDAMFTKWPSNGSDGPCASRSKWNVSDGKEISGNGLDAHGNLDIIADDRLIAGQHEV